MTTLLCVPITVESVESALADATSARTAGADLVEYRIDRLFHGEGDSEGERGACRLCAESPLPCIITCRPAWEGGEYDGDESARISLFEKLATLDRPPRYIDVEAAALARSANVRQKVRLAVEHDAQPRDLKTSLILSAHDFAGRPAGLLGTLASMREESAARVLKVAYTARSLRDMLELFELLRERDRPMIALGMGEFGAMSRLLAGKFGAFLTFASLRPSAATAPGQPTIADLLLTYRFRSISDRTAVYGVIGWPVGHSISPVVHNAGFEAVGHDGVYVPMPIAPGWEPFKATVLELLGFAALDFRGASVTIPHKEHLLRLALEDRTHRWEVEPRALWAGAANTLTRRADGSILLSNTDAPAAAGALADPLGGALEGARVSVLGAGGAARGVAAGLLERGAEVVVHARRREQAENLVQQLRAARIAQAATIEIGGWGDSGADLRPCLGLVNCTPMGMEGGPEPTASPVDPRLLEQADLRVVMDTVYKPLETPMIRAARALGLGVVTGDRMFITQAARQFESWTGRVPPSGLFERLVHEVLARSTRTD